MSTPKKIFVIDVEATCWDNDVKFGRGVQQYVSDIIEIGITTVDLKERRIEASDSILVIPTQSEISTFCTGLTTITPELIEKEGVSFHRAMDILDDDYKVGKNMWGSWGLYDYKILARQCEREHTRIPLNNLHLNIKAMFAWQFGFSMGLGKACNYLGIKFEGTAHRGVDDSKMIAKILLELEQPFPPTN